MRRTVVSHDLIRIELLFGNIGEIDSLRFAPVHKIGRIAGHNCTHALPISFVKVAMEIHIAPALCISEGHVLRIEGPLRNN